MKELTFREVIANIKEGEVWESTNKKIKLENNNIIVNSKITNCNGEFVVTEHTKFTLRRNKVSFQEAFKAYEEGKEIESCVSEWRYKIVDGMVKINTGKNGTRTNFMGEITFSTTEIQGEWYIN